VGDGASALERFEEAERTARRSLDLEPRDPWAHLNLGASLMEQYRLGESADEAVVDEAIRHYGQALDLMREEAGANAGDDTAYVSALVNVCDAQLQAGRPETALGPCREAAERVRGDAVPFYNLAGAYALLGRFDDALAALERDFELGDRDWAYLAEDLWFESLRGDPRFQAIVERMRLPPTE
jgi:tetratricopeptide (TPR) repeat protein